MSKPRPTRRAGSAGTDGTSRPLARSAMALGTSSRAGAAGGGHGPGSPIVTFGLFYTGAFDRTEFYFGHDFLWDGELERVVLPPDIPDLIAESLDQVRDYRAGQSYVEHWNRAPFGSAFAGRTMFSLLPDFRGAPVRSGDTLSLVPSMFSDQAVPARGSSSHVSQDRLTLSRNGQVIASQDSALRTESLTIDVPPEPALYRLEQDSTRPAGAFPLSTHVTAAWTFHSQHSEGAPLPLPVPMLRFLPELDDHNQTAARALVLPIRIDHPDGSKAPRTTDLHVAASFDDGATWSAVPTLLLGDRAVGLVVHPRGATAVSLRGSAADVAGNAVEQTIIRAYTVAPR